jgi:hypothetical protein
MKSETKWFVLGFGWDRKYAVNGETLGWDFTLLVDLTSA